MTTTIDQKAGRKFFSKKGKTIVALFNILLPAIDSVIRHQIYRLNVWK